ncbi:hypothetical protein QL285_070999 [Trifolium repens]|nr:hypothetical protein QL285_070999 [Trifolium repens]
MHYSVFANIDNSLVAIDVPQIKQKHSSREPFNFLRPLRRVTLLIWENKYDAKPNPGNAISFSSYYHHAIYRFLWQQKPKIRT